LLEEPYLVIEHSDVKGFNYLLKNGVLIYLCRCFDTKKQKTNLQWRLFSLKSDFFQEI
jgi:nitrogen fixation protein